MIFLIALGQQSSPTIFEMSSLWFLNIIGKTDFLFHDEVFAQQNDKIKKE